MLGCREFCGGHFATKCDWVDFRTKPWLIIIGQVFQCKFHHLPPNHINDTLLYNQILHLNQSDMDKKTRSNKFNIKNHKDTNHYQILLIVIMFLNEREKKCEIIL